MKLETPLRSEARLRAARVFARNLALVGIERVVDLGADPATFTPMLRASGYDGVVFAGAASTEELVRLVKAAEVDVRWLVWRHELHASPTALPNTDALCSSELARRIGGARVSLDRLDPEKLEALTRALPELGVLFLEHVSDGAASPSSTGTLDSWLSEHLGFRRVLLESQLETDDADDDASWTVAVYRRVGTTAGHSKRVGKLGPFDVVTSLGGNIRRETADGRDVGAVWQERCLASFLSTAPRVVSVSECAPPHDAIAWHRTESRPSIAELMAAIDASGRSAIVVNGDIVVTSNLLELVESFDPAAFHFANRIEVEVAPNSTFALNPTGVYNVGYDLFVVPHALARAITAGNELPAVFRVGEPWWDYALPIVARSLGYPLKRLSPEKPVALHLSHPARFSGENWVDHGLRYLELLDALHRKRPGRLGALVPTLAAKRATQPNPLDYLNFVSRATVGYLT